MNLISYEEQVYLIYYWMRTNLINFEPTFENIKDQLYVEFDVEDDKAAEGIYTLFHEE